MRKSLLLAIGLFVATALGAQPRLSDNAQVSLLTCEPSDAAVYTNFGHTALRIYDSAQGIDWVFNYGVFSFEQPNFIGRFITGATDYELGINETSQFLYTYRLRGSDVYEQHLNLTTEEKERLWDALLTNYKEENRTYRYNFIFDNCATRPYYILVSCLNDTMNYTGQHHETTYRKLIEEHVPNNTWLKFGIDLLLGHNADTLIGKHNEELFLPLYLKDRLANTTITRNDSTYSLVDNNDVHHASKADLPVTQNPFKPVHFELILFALTLLLCAVEYYTHTYARWFDCILWSVCGIVGIVILFLMLFSEHPLVEWNLNLLWAHPIHLIFVVLLIQNKHTKLLRSYQIMNLFLMAVVLTSMLKSMQEIQVLHPSLHFIIDSLLIRSALYVYRNTPKQQQHA